VARPLATQQFDVLREIFDLSRAQRQCIEREELDRFAALMDERDALLQELQALVQEEASLPENVVPIRGEDGHADDTLALDTVIRGILEHDRKNEALLGEKMDAIREELPRLAQGARANAGYRMSGGTGSFTNRVS
jgi:hypothetical protein